MKVVHKVSVLLLVFVLASALILGACAPPAPAPSTPSAPPAPKLPEVFRMTVLPMGTLGYAISLPLAEALKGKTGISLRVIPGGSEVARVLPARIGEADFIFVMGGSLFAVAHGFEDFAREEWGPQPVRCVWQGESLTGICVGADSDIKTLADLKGKKVYTVAANYFVESAVTGYLAFASLTWKDVTRLVAPSTGAAGKGVIEGSGDACFQSPTSTAAYELEASKHGIRWLPTPKADAKGWEALWKYAPFVYPTLAVRGAGISKDKPVEESLCPYPILAYKNLPADWAYVMTKGLWEGYDIYKDKHAELPIWTHDVCLSYKRLMSPYHEGTVKFFKEKGVWTPAMEEWQNRQVKLEEARLAEWDKAKTAAAEKKIKLDTPEFSGFWENWLKERKLISYPEF